MLLTRHFVDKAVSLNAKLSAFPDRFEVIREGDLSGKQQSQDTSQPFLFTTMIGLQFWTDFHNGKSCYEPCIESWVAPRQSPSICQPASPCATHMSLTSTDLVVANTKSPIASSHAVEIADDVTLTPTPSDSVFPKSRLERVSQEHILKRGQKRKRSIEEEGSSKEKGDGKEEGNGEGEKDDKEGKDDEEEDGEVARCGKIMSYIFCRIVFFR